MEHEHGKWRELILSHEDLEPPERELADRHLAACASCRKLLSDIRTIERSGGPAGTLPPFEPGAAPPTSPDGEAAAEASLRALRARLGLEESEPRSGHAALPPLPSPKVWLRRRAMRVLPALAAAAAVSLIIWSPWRDGGPAPAPFQRLEVVSRAGARGAPDAAPATAWHRGDAFSLRLTLDRDACPIVLHLDPAGGIHLLHPEVAAAPIPRYAAGSPIELPPPGSGREWVFEGAAGRQILIVAAAPRSDLELGPILGAVETPRPTETGLGAAAVKRLLESRVGPVAMLEVPVLP
jgi:hypothetical protein